MSIDKQYLREVAKQATGTHERINAISADDIFDISLHHDGAQLDADITDLNSFNEAANPATVLELLDELEAAEKRIAELEAREVKLPNPHAHLIWIQAGHAPDDYWDDVAVSHSEKDKCCDGSDRYPVYTLWEIKEALSAIGINIAAAGKGEDS